MNDENETRAVSIFMAGMMLVAIGVLIEWGIGAMFVVSGAMLIALFTGAVIKNALCK